MKPDASGSVQIATRIQKLVENGKLEAKGCTHIAQIKDVIPSADGCEDCLKTGDKWVHLRLCLTCGYVGCCDNSKNKHATRHFQETHHPMIVSFEPEEEWIWCFVDEALIKPK